jgi:hypothetical protein
MGEVEKLMEMEIAYVRAMVGKRNEALIAIRWTKIIIIIIIILKK